RRLRLLRFAWSGDSELALPPFDPATKRHPRDIGAVEPHARVLSRERVQETFEACVVVWIDEHPQRDLASLAAHGLPPGSQGFTVSVTAVGVCGAWAPRRRGAEGVGGAGGGATCALAAGVGSTTAAVSTVGGAAGGTVAELATKGWRGPGCV